MDIFNFAKAVEQGIFDVMMWIFFYPYTLLRMLFLPGPMLTYVDGEALKEPDDAFSSAMRPALFLFISIAIGSMFAPLSPEQVTELQTKQIGGLIADSWFALLFFRMVAFSFFPLTGAVMLDVLTPGRITRHTLRRPFYLQCYICAPFALIASPALVALEKDDGTMMGLTLLMVAWFVVVQFIFFRKFGNLRWFWAAPLAPVAFVGGLTAIIVMGRLTLG